MGEKSRCRQRAKSCVTLLFVINRERKEVINHHEKETQRKETNNRKAVLIRFAVDIMQKTHGDMEAWRHAGMAGPFPLPP